MEPTVDNVLDVYRRATPDQIKAGRNWYLEAHRLAISLDPTDIHRSAGVIAALSPMQQWPVNIMFAKMTFEKGEACGNTFANRAKAQRIFEGEDPLNVLTSNKIRNFYLNISDPFSNSGVTVDRHAFDIAVGEVTNDKVRGTLSRKGRYDLFANVYRNAALLFNIPAPAMQAITWVVWREEKGIK